MEPLPEAIDEAWRAYDGDRAVVGFEETSPGVSTNCVLRLDLEDGEHVFAKSSSYGSYVHFRQDHDRILQWRAGLAGTPFENLLAAPLQKEGRVFTHRGRREWVAFYEEVPRHGLLPKILHPREIDSLGEQVAGLHEASVALVPPLAPTWKTAGSDLAQLFDRVAGSGALGDNGWSSADCSLLAHQCDRFFSAADSLGYHSMRNLPVLVDWNRGNFSVKHTDEGGIVLFSRWDYDWFRVGPRVFDFYFLARLARADGDQTAFSYSAAPLFEERFVRMLRRYHAVSPLMAEELLFMREAYRFFLLNYVIRQGSHFFVPQLHERLSREALDRHLPGVDDLDFDSLVKRVLR